MTALHFLSTNHRNTATTVRLSVQSGLQRTDLILTKRYVGLVVEMEASIRNQRISVTGGKVGDAPLCVAAVSISPQELQGCLYRCKKTGAGRGGGGRRRKAQQAEGLSVCEHTFQRCQ